MTAREEPRPLRRTDIAGNPFVQFEHWFEAARQAGHLEPTAAALATAGADGRTSCRMVLMKRFDRNGFVFFTNAESRKGSDLEANPRAALTFWWDRLQRQVRIEGAVSRIPAGESDDYFASRPLGSRIGAWASAQSRVLENRQQLEEQVRQAAERFADTQVPRPEHWGGFRIEPETVEFWQGQQSRLHDRLRYRRDGDGWLVERLAP